MKANKKDDFSIRYVAWCKKNDKKVGTDAIKEFHYTRGKSMFVCPTHDRCNYCNGGAMA